MSVELWLIASLLLLLMVGGAVYWYVKRRTAPPTGVELPGLYGTRALITAGYWPLRSMPSNYWATDYWPEYGTALPPAVSTDYSFVVMIRRRRR